MILLSERIELDHPDDLHLTHLAPDDAEVLREYYNANEVFDPRMAPNGISERRSRAIVVSRLEATGRGEVAPYIIRNAGNVVVGEVQLYEHRGEYAQIQFSVADDMRRRRIATVAVNTLVDHGKQWWGITRLGFVIDPEDERYQAFVRSIGAEYEVGYDRTNMYDPSDPTVMQSWEKQL